MEVQAKYLRQTVLRGGSSLVTTANKDLIRASTEAFGAKYLEYQNHKLRKGDVAGDVRRLRVI
jgi:hypothetical protein